MATECNRFQSQGDTDEPGLQMDVPPCEFTSDVIRELALGFPLFVE